MKNTERTWVEINLDNISHNVKQIKSILNADTKLIGVVKADAYGHGAIEIAETILKNGVDFLAVAFIDEAMELRNNGINAPILLLGNTLDPDIDVLLKNNITPTVFTFDLAQKISKRASELNIPAKIHIKVDTGMHRIGFLYSDSIDDKKNTTEKILEISKLPNIQIEGMFTHLATSDEEDTSYTYLQLKRFTELKSALLGEGLDIPICHTSNSAAIVRFPEFSLNAVRAGIILYGMYPSKEVSLKGLDLKPAMSFKSRIINIKDLPEGCDISYGRSFRTSAPSKIATVSAGYADGYSRLLSNKVSVLVSDHPVKQVGKICMDLCMIDVTNVNNINIGDEVTLFGSGGNTHLPIEDIAKIMGTINYEVACMISKRVPRIYIENQKTVKSINYLLPDESL